MPTVEFFWVPYTHLSMPQVPILFGMAGEVTQLQNSLCLPAMEEEQRGPCKAPCLYFNIWVPIRNPSQVCRNKLSEGV